MRFRDVPLTRGRWRWMVQWHPRYCCLGWLRERNGQPFMSAVIGPISIHVGRRGSIRMALMQYMPLLVIGLALVVAGGFRRRSSTPEVIR